MDIVFEPTEKDRERYRMIEYNEDIEVIYASIVDESIPWIVKSIWKPIQTL